MQTVREVIIVKTGEMPKYMYEVSSLDSDNQVCAYEKDSLELLYHDSTWEEYFTEHTQNSYRSGEAKYIIMTYLVGLMVID